MFVFLEEKLSFSDIGPKNRVSDYSMHADSKPHVIQCIEGADLSRCIGPSPQGRRLPLSGHLPTLRTPSAPTLRPASTATIDPGATSALI